MTCGMATQEAIRRQALEMQDSIKELQKFAEQARKKDAALKAAAARRPKAPVISNADGEVQQPVQLQTPTAVCCCNARGAITASGRWCQSVVPALWQARQDADTIKAVAGRNSDSIAAAKQRTSGQKPGAGFSFDRSGSETSTSGPELPDSHRERGNALFKVSFLLQRAYPLLVKVHTEGGATPYSVVEALPLHDPAGTRDLISAMVCKL